MISFLFILASNLIYVNEPVVDMRESPSNESKVVSQALFSEQVTLEKEEGDWSSIFTPDGYSGWIPSETLAKRSTPYDATLQISRLAAHLYGVMDTEWGAIKTLPYGTKLHPLDITDPRWIKIALPDDEVAYIQRGDVALEPKPTTKDDLVEFSKKFLGLPFTWGGRSSFGYDSSGFVQMLYSQIGIDFQRDSYQQILDPRFQTILLEDLEPGDLVFFGKSQQIINRVGMYIGQGQFIHATVRENMPWIRISNLTDFEWSGHPETNSPYRTGRQLME